MSDELTSTKESEALGEPLMRAPGLKWKGLGFGAGFVAIGCCVYPTVLAFVGLASAAEAIALGRKLYGVWGWAFRLGGVLVALAGIVYQVRRQKACDIDAEPKTLASFVGRIVAVAVVVYTAFFWLTKWLEKLGEGS